METSKIAKQFAEANRLPRACKYDFFLREFYDMVEVVGLIEDPTLNMTEFNGREMLYPKRWVTLAVVPASTTIPKF
jgi:hypothetical protein